MRVSVSGAGIAGLTCALELAARGAQVEVFERAAAPGTEGCSWFAGGMLAPWCERESSPELITQLGLEGIDWWRAHFPATQLQGTLVLAPARDQGELVQFARRSGAGESLDGAGVARLEPELAGRFSSGLYFAGEGHLDPRAALSALSARLRALGVPIHFGREAPASDPARARLECRGLAARDALPGLRGVKGEMLLLKLPELTLTRPVRLLHPRLPVYVVPRGGGLYMVGASMIESDQATRVSARSLLELLAAAYALHPAFGEAEVLELGTGVRAAYPDNLPRLSWVGGALHVNGLYRHGFLIAPALARRAAEHLLAGASFPEVMHEDPGQRRLA